MPKQDNKKKYILIGAALLLCAGGYYFYTNANAEENEEKAKCGFDDMSIYSSTDPDRTDEDLGEQKEFDERQVEEPTNDENDENIDDNEVKLEKNEPVEKTDVTPADTKEIDETDSRQNSINNDESRKNLQQNQKLESKISESKNCEDAGPPIANDLYKKLGQFKKIGDLDFYQIGKSSSKVAIIFIYDIFGWNKTSSNVFKVCDTLAKNNNALVIMADHFRGKHVPVEDFPPTTDLELDHFDLWKEAISPEIIYRKDIYEIMLPYIHNTLRIKKRPAIIGTCLGGTQCFNLSGDDSRFSCIVSVHGAYIDKKLTDKVNVPLLYFAAKGDTNGEDIKKWMSKKNPNLAKKSEFKNMFDVGHGYFAARGNWKEQVVNQNVIATHVKITDFLRKRLH